MSEKAPDPALIDAVYRKAFPNDAEEALLASTRKVVIADRIGPAEPMPANAASEMRATLKTLGFDRSMIEVVRDKSPIELGLLLHHAQQTLSDDVENGRAFPREMQAPPHTFRGGAAPGNNRLPSWGVGFNRALSRTDADLAAIDAAIAALTGKEPPRSRSR